MRFHLVPFLVCLSAIMAAGLVSARPAAAGNSTSPPADKAPFFRSAVGIWYTLWWRDEGSPFYEHWDDWSRMRPELGYYSSGDPVIIRRHMALLKSMGIDFVILDDTNGHLNDGGSIAENLDAVFQTVEEMGDEAPKLCVALGGAFNDRGNTEQRIAERESEADTIHMQYADSPVYYRWKGKPLLISYGIADFVGWTDDRFTVRYASGSVKEVVAAGKYPATGLWGWVFNQDVPNDEVVGVIPGFNKSFEIQRAGGDTYSSMWLRAVKADPEAVVIVSFNDFAEEVAIEPARPRPDADVDAALARERAKTGRKSVLDYRKARGVKHTDHTLWTDTYGEPAPNWYLELTAGYSRLPSGPIPGYYYREESSKLTHQYLNSGFVPMAGDAPPHGHPVIVVPDGYLEWASTDTVHGPK